MANTVFPNKRGTAMITKIIKIESVIFVALGGGWGTLCCDENNKNKMWWKYNEKFYEGGAVNTNCIDRKIRFKRPLNRQALCFFFVFFFLLHFEKYWKKKQNKTNYLLPGINNIERKIFIKLYWKAHVGWYLTRTHLLVSGAEKKQKKKFVF